MVCKILKFCGGHGTILIFKMKLNFIFYFDLKLKYYFRIYSEIQYFQNKNKHINSNIMI